jgi:hypothetical protein
MVAKWVEAVGTAGALLLGMVLLGIELRDRRAQRAERTRSQAARISAWCVEAGSSGPDGHSVTIAVQNRSEEPIYNVAVHVMSGDVADFVASVAVVIPPAARESYPIASPTMVRHDQTHWPTVVDLAFTDTRGRRWVRRADGALELDAELATSKPVV